MPHLRYYLYGAYKRTAGGPWEETPARTEAPSAPPPGGTFRGIYVPEPGALTSGNFEFAPAAPAVSDPTLVVPEWPVDFDLDPNFTNIIIVRPFGAYHADISYPDNYTRRIQPFSVVPLQSGSTSDTRRYPVTDPVDMRGEGPINIANATDAELAARVTFARAEPLWSGDNPRDVYPGDKITYDIGVGALLYPLDGHFFSGQGVPYVRSLIGPTPDPEPPGPYVTARSAITLSNGVVLSAPASFPVSGTFAPVTLRRFSMSIQIPANFPAYTYLNTLQNGTQRACGILHIYWGGYSFAFGFPNLFVLGHQGQPPAPPGGGGAGNGNDVCLLRDYTGRRHVYFVNAAKNLAVRLFGDGDLTHTSVTVDAATNCAGPSFYLVGNVIEGTYLRGQTIVLARSRTHGRTWQLMATTIPGAYLAQSSTPLRGGTLRAVAGYKDGAGWVLRLGRLQADGTYAWSPERAIALPAGVQKHGDLRARDDGALEFTVLQSDGSPLVKVGKRLGLDGLGDWR